MPKLKLLGIKGRIGSGKTHAAKVIAGNEKELRVVVVNIGDVIWDHCFKPVFGPIEGHCKDRVRDIMQAAGHYGRQWREDFWLEKVKARVKSAVDAWADCAIVTGVRHPNEAKWIKEEGGIVWDILAGNHLLWDPANAHPAEGHGVKADENLINDGTKNFDLDVLSAWAEFKKR